MGRELQPAAPLPDAGAARGAEPVVERGVAVASMFDRIAGTYDRANRAMTLGIDTLWRRRALGTLELAAGARVLDLCAGTLDFSLALVRRHGAQVDAVDFSAGMLEVGRSRLPEGARVQLHQADAQELPLADSTYNGAVCGFGLRNVTDNRRALAEVLRVLQPGARFAVLELFRPVSWGARAFHAVFDRTVLPLLGGWISGDRAAYAYLAGSPETYLTRAEFVSLAREVGFEVHRAGPLFPPVASLVVLGRPPSAPSGPGESA